MPDMIEIPTVNLYSLDHDELEYRLIPPGRLRQRPIITGNVDSVTVVGAKLPFPLAPTCERFSELSVLINLNFRLKFQCHSFIHIRISGIGSHFWLSSVVVAVAYMCTISWGPTRVCYSENRPDEEDCCNRYFPFLLTACMSRSDLLSVSVFTAQCTLVHMRGLGIACRLSVCLSVRLSVCL